MSIRRGDDRVHPLEELWSDLEWRRQAWSVVLVFALWKLAFDYRIGWLHVVTVGVAAVLSGYLLMGAMYLLAVAAHLPSYLLHRLRRLRH